MFDCFWTFNFDIGEIFIDSVPIDSDDRTAFFGFQSLVLVHQAEDLRIWLDGGLGCFSLFKILDWKLLSDITIMARIRSDSRFQNGQQNQSRTFLPFMNRYALSNLYQSDLGKTRGWNKHSLHVRYKQNPWQTQPRTLSSSPINPKKSFMTGEATAGHCVLSIDQVFLKIKRYRTPPPH